MSNHGVPSLLDFILFDNPDLLGLVVASFVLLLSIVLHELGHAAVATWLGDPTARQSGRLSPNPKVHLDPFGTVAVVLIGLGWGKPVPVAINRLRFGAAGRNLVNLAGPATNLILAFAGALGLALSGEPQFSPLQRFFSYLFAYNVPLAIFNLLPIPPLDGFRILSSALPYKRQNVIEFIEQWGFLLLLLVGFFLFWPLLGPLVRVLSAGIRALTGA